MGKRVISYILVLLITVLFGGEAIRICYLHVLKVIRTSN